MNLTDKDLQAIVKARRFKARGHWIWKFWFAIFMLAPISLVPLLVPGVPQFLKYGLLPLPYIFVAAATGCAYIYGRRERQAARRFIEHYRTTGQLLPEGPDGKTEIPL